MNAWLPHLLDDLSDPANWAYQPGGPCAAEPTALTTLALAGHGRISAANKAARRLVELQAADGGVAVTAQQTAPCWPTGWAVLAWSRTDALRGERQYREYAERGIRYIQRLHGQTIEQVPDMGHNTQLDGWPWVIGTHPWSEPTAVNLLALKAAGQGNHPRAREAAMMLVDRLLPDGGCNYGNTVVLGNTLRPHAEPTGLVVAALAGETDASGRLHRSLNWLERVVGTVRGGASLAYALLGLRAHGRCIASQSSLLAAAARQGGRWRQSPLRKSLIALAAVDPCALANGGTT